MPEPSGKVHVTVALVLCKCFIMFAEKVLTYACAVMRKPALHWSRIAMGVNLAWGYKSPYTRYMMKWKAATDTSLLSTKMIKKSIVQKAITDVLKQQRDHSTTTFAMNAPEHGPKTHWFKPKAWVTDSARTKIISIFRACNASLGNRGPTKDGQFFSLCPLCSKAGQNAINNEVCQKCCPKIYLTISCVLGPHAYGVSPYGQVQK